VPSSRDRSMLVQAATLYYLEGCSQAEVAQAIGVTRSNVSRVLSEARRLGIVEIRVHGDAYRNDELERQIEDRFGIGEVIVVQPLMDSPALPVVGRIGAEWLLEHVPTNGSIAVSWGSGVQALVESVTTANRHPEVEVLPLVGGLSGVESTRDANVLVRELANRLGAAHRRLYAPAIVESKESRDALLREPAIRGVLDDAKRADLAVVGIGAVGSGASSEIIRAMNLNESERQAFEQSQAVGDCCTRYFNDSGNAIDGVVNNRVIAVELEDLRQIPTVMGVACGRAKAPGVRALLRGEILDALFIDAELAESLLSLEA